MDFPEKPMQLARILQLPELLAKKSFFLFGPRASGKSFLIRQQFGSTVPVINLLNNELFLRLSANPHELASIINTFNQQDIVVIDEVQLVPALLNEVHRLIEEKHIKFLLTGSSARNLKQKHVNLLAGRAREAHLFPLVSTEIPNFDLQRYLRYGGLPPVYLSAEPQEELHAYVNTYLKQEVQAESLVRKIPAFSRFLQIAAVTSGEVLNFTAVASDAGISAATIREYYQILEDTFLGFMVPAWTKTVRRKSSSTAKFYLFDIGIKNTLARIQTIDPQSDLFGKAFEHFIAMELRAYLSYRRTHLSLSYWRTKHGHEVDFIIGDDVAIEVKSSNRISDKHFKNLRALAEENLCKRYLLVSHDNIARKEGKIETMHWQDFLTKLWQNEIL